MSLIPEIRDVKDKVQNLEKEKEALEQSLQFSQGEIMQLKKDAASTAAKLAEASDKLAKLDEPERRLIKQESHNIRNNINFFGIKMMASNHLKTRKDH